MTNATRLKVPLTLALALTAALVLTSCDQLDNPVVGATSVTPSTAPSTSASSSPSRRIDITVKGRKVTPRPAMVNIAVGESLTITVTSDHDDTLHAHEFNIEEDFKAGRRLEITVKGAQPGVYDVELHHPELRLFQVAVR